MNGNIKTPLEWAAEGWTESCLEMNETERLAAFAAIAKRVMEKERMVPSSIPSTKRSRAELLAVERRFLESIKEPNALDSTRLKYDLGDRAADLIVAGVEALLRFMVPMDQRITRGPQNALGNVYNLKFCRAALERFTLAAPLSTHECLKIEVVDGIVRPMDPSPSSEE